MAFNIASVQAVLQMIPAALRTAAAVREVVGEIGKTLGERDQQKLQATYAGLIAENDAGHVRLQGKLRRAAGDVE